MHQYTFTCAKRIQTTLTAMMRRVFNSNAQPVSRSNRAILSGWLCFVLILSGCAFLGQTSADNEAAQIKAGQASASLEIWTPLRAGFDLPQMDSPLVANQIRAYTRSPSHLKDALNLSRPYLYFILEEVNKRNMPTEMALLPFLESGFNIRRGNSLNHAGLWGLMPIAAKHLNLVQNPFKDERRDIILSTRAALDLLQELHAKFNGDWFLALAAYNWGPGNVERAIIMNKRKGLPTQYQHLKMPQETMVFVPKLLALRQIIEKPSAYGIALPDIPNKPYFAQIDVKHAIDISLVLKWSGLSINEFIELNPSFNKSVIPAGPTQKLLLPIATAPAYLERYQTYDEPLSSMRTVVIETPQTLYALAKELNIDANRTRQLNGLRWGGLLTVGTTIMIHRPSLKTD
jgi:membrane-bound lytic murein transglycosylase D